MYSYEDRIRAVKLYMKYDRSAADTIRGLGYLARSMLVRWYKEYREQGDLHERFKKERKYTLDKVICSIDSIASKIPLKVLLGTT